MPVLRTNSRSSSLASPTMTPPPAVNDRPFGSLDGRRDLRDLLGAGRGDLRHDSRADSSARRSRAAICACCTSLGMSISTGPGRPVVAMMERFAHDAGQVVDVGHQVMVLGDAAADLDDRRFLKGVGADDRACPPGR